MHLPPAEAKISACTTLDKNPLNYKFLGIQVMYNPIKQILMLEFDPVWTLYADLILNYLRKQRMLSNNPEDLKINVCGRILDNTTPLHEFVSVYEMSDCISIQINTNDNVLHEMLTDAEFFLYQPLKPGEFQEFLKKRRCS